MDVIKTYIEDEERINPLIHTTYRNRLYSITDFALTTFKNISIAPTSTITSKFYFDTDKRRLKMFQECTSTKPDISKYVLKTSIIVDIKSDNDLDILGFIQVNATENGEVVDQKFGYTPEDMEFIGCMVNRFFEINIMLMDYLPTLTINESSESVRTVASKKHGKIKYKKEVNLVRQIRLNDDWERKASQHHSKITCPAWNVRGHYRHMRKSGKVVYVHPHVKGKERKNPGMIVEKTYRLKEETKVC